MRSTGVLAYEPVATQDRRVRHSSSTMKLGCDARMISTGFMPVRRLSYHSRGTSTCERRVRRPDYADADFVAIVDADLRTRPGRPRRIDRCRRNVFGQRRGEKKRRQEGWILVVLRLLNALSDVDMPPATSDGQLYRRAANPPERLRFPRVLSVGRVSPGGRRATDHPGGQPHPNIRWLGAGWRRTASRPPASDH